MKDNPDIPSKWTILSLLKWTTAYFKKKGISEPRTSAELLLAHVLKIKRIDLYIYFDKPVQQDELKQFKTLILRRLRHEPIQYIIGKTEFWSREFYLTKEVLIPRPETESIIENILNLLRNNKKETYTIMDIGTGSGIIAVTLAMELPNSIIFAGDINLASLKVAKKNIERYLLQDRIHLICSNVFGAIKREALFDIIVSNPPYVSHEEWQALPPEIKGYEPKEALMAGVDGLDVIKKIIKEAYLYLKKGGYLILEIGAFQAKKVKDLFKNEYRSIEIHKDYSGWDRVVIARKI